MHRHFGCLAHWLGLLQRRSGSIATVFLDTEFTGLDWRYPRRLISIGLVASEERLGEWYAEIDGWSAEDCTPWVQGHVFPLLTGPRVTRKAAAKSLRAWLARLSAQGVDVEDIVADFKKARKKSAPGAGAKAK